MLLHLTNKNVNISLKDITIPLTDREELDYLVALSLGFTAIQRDSTENFVGIDPNGNPFILTPIPVVGNDYLHRKLGKALVKAKGYTSLQRL